MRTQDVSLSRWRRLFGGGVRSTPAAPPAHHQNTLEREQAEQGEEEDRGQRTETKRGDWVDCALSAWSNTRRDAAAGQYEAGQEMSGFRSWPAPPAAFTPQFRWAQNENVPARRRRRTLCGYVYAREVREEFLSFFGVWSTLNEDCGVPKLLDEPNFEKYCYYYIQREDLHAEGGDMPDDYIPMDYVVDEPSRRMWRGVRLEERRKQQFGFPI